MLTRLITRLEDRATAVIERAIRNALRLEIAQLVKLVEDIHATQRLELETTADEPDYQLMLAELELDKPAPTPPAAVMQTVTFADLAQEDTAPGATSLPSLTPKQRADLKWGEHPLGLVPVNWLADRLGIPADWIREAAEERGIEQLHFSNGLRYGHAWRHWLDLWGPAKVREWLGTHGNFMDLRRYEEAVKRGDR